MILRTASTIRKACAYPFELGKSREFSRGSAQFTDETRFRLRICAYPLCTLSYSTLTAPSSIPMNCMSIPGTAHSGNSANNSLGNNYARRSVKALTNIYPSFSRPKKSNVSAKSWMNTGPSCSEKNIFQRSDRFRKCANFFSASTTTTNASVLASSGKKADTKYYIDLLKIGDLIEGYVSGDDADSSKPAPDIFAASLEKLDDISAADAVTVGDTRFDIEAAKKAGLTTIAFLCGGTPESMLREAGAIAIYRDPADLLVHYDELMK